MTRSLARAVAVALVLLAGATARAYADELDPPPGPDGAVEVSPPADVAPTVDPFLDDLVDMVNEGSALAPPPS